MAKLVLKSNFRGPCIVCNCMPVDEQSEVHKPLPMFHAEGRDVNWGEDLNICQICAGVMADMMGRADAKKHRELEDEVAELREELAETKTTFEAYREKARRVIDGKKAQKEMVG